MQNQILKIIIAVVITLMLTGPSFAQQPASQDGSSSAAETTPSLQPSDPAASPEKPETLQNPTVATPPVASPEIPVVIQPEKDESGFLVCYRERRFVGAALNTSVHVDDVEIADMDNGCYIIVKVKPGEHKLYADEKKDAFTINVEAGKFYYFRMELAMGLWKGHGRLKGVDNSIGEKEFKEWNLKLAPDIRQPEMVVKEL